MTYFIRLQFSAERSLSSLLIRWYGAGKVSHVDAVMPDGRLLGARMIGGVQIRPKDYARFTNVVRVSIPVDLETYTKFYAFLQDQVGQPYDFWAILGFVANRDWRNDDQWICSELIIRALEVCGVFGRLFLASYKITPPAAALAVSTLPKGVFSVGPCR